MGRPRRGGGVTNYARGATYERKAKATLESQGYSVMRSAGSHSPADLVGLSPHSVKLVQVKAFKLTPKQLREAMDELLEMRAPRGTEREVWCWVDHAWEVHVV